MEIDVFVHGVPNGAKLWNKEGVRDEIDYFQTFYNQKNDEVDFYIQVRRNSKNKVYCYYNYLVYKNVVSSEGRAGSYCGLTIRMDAYYKNAANLYKIMDALFNSYIIGDVLQPKQGKLQYTVPDFAPVSDKLKKMEDELLQYVLNTFKREQLMPLDGFPMTSTRVLLNLYDSTPEAVYNIIRQNGCISISPFYERKSDADKKKKFEEHIQKIQKDCEARLKEKENECKREIGDIINQKESAVNALQNSLNKVKEELNRINGEKNSANSKIQQLMKTIEEKTSKISELEAEKKKIGHYKKIEEMVAPIRQPIKDLAGVMNELMPDEPTSTTPLPTSRRMNWKTLGLIVGIVVFLSVIIGFFVSISSMNIKMQDISCSINNILDEQKEQVLPSIDIPEYNGKGPLIIGKKYRVELKDGNRDGVWSADGGTLMKTNDPDIVEFTPIDTIFSIVYFKQLSSRTLNAVSTKSK